MEHGTPEHDTLQEEIPALGQRLARVDKELAGQGSSEGHNRTIAELDFLSAHMSDGYASLDGHVVCKVNHALCLILGITETHIIGRPFSDLFAIEDRAIVKNLIGQATGCSDSVCQTNVSAQRKNNEQVVLFLIAQGAGEGNLVRVLVRDMSATDQGREELDRRDRYFRALIEYSLDACMVFDDTGTIRYLSPSYRDLLGYEHNERIGTPILANVHPDDEAHARDIFQMQMQRPGKSARMELRSRHKDGSWRYIEASGTNLMLDPNIRGFIANIRDITSRKLAEKALIEKEEHFRTLIENSSDAIAIIDAAGTILYESPSSQRIVGYDTETILNRNVMEFVHPEDRDRIQSVLAHLSGENDRVVSTELRFRHGNGSWITLEGTAKNLLHEPHVNGIVVNYRNVTERRLAEKALKESEERYRLLAENLLDVIWTMGPDYKYTYISPSVTRLRGYSQEEAMALSLKNNLTPTSLKDVSQIIAKYLNDPGGGNQLPSWMSVEAELTRKDGGSVWTENSITFLRDDHGTITGCLGVTRDIEQRRKAEGALRESEAKYAAVVEHAMDGVIIWQDNYAKFANPAASHISGYCLEEICGTPFLNMLPEARRSEIGGLYRSLLTGRQMVNTYQIEIRQKNGQTKPVEVSIARILYQGKPAVMGVIRDITSRKLAEEERVMHAATLARAEALNVSRQRIVKVQESLRKEIANEIHGSVQNRIILLMHKIRELESASPGNQLVAELREVHKRMGDILNDHLRPISHRLFPSILRQGLVPALQSLCDQFEKALVIDLNIDKSLVESERDDRRLIPETIRLSACRITEEALNNIVKHSGADRVNISLAWTAEKLRLEICDNGQGFNPGQVSAGTGMLMIQDYAEVAGGTWSINSTPGSGTKINAIFELPGNE